MASYFPRDARCLLFRWARRGEPVLWPAWAWRVVVPEPRERMLDMLERAVMSLCRAGTVQARRIAARLHLHEDLAAYVLVDLAARGLLTAEGLPTDQGLSALEEDGADSRTLVTGHVFQDPWTQAVWPRFVRQLEGVDVERGEDGWPVLQIGTAGAPRTLHPFVVLPDGSPPPVAPQPDQIVTAARDHFRDQARHERRERDPEGADEDDDEGPDIAPIAADSVAFVDEDPQPVLLATRLTVSPDGPLIADPFGLGPAWFLRDPVDAALRESSSFYGKVTSLNERNLDSGLDAQKQWIAALQAQARHSLHEVLPPEAEAWPGYDALFSMHVSAAEIERLGRECPDEKRRTLLMTARRALEATLAGLLPASGTEVIWRPLLAAQKVRGFVAERCEQAARDCGFRVPVPKALAGVRAGAISMVLRDPGGGAASRLRPMVAAALLVAQQDPQHALRRCAARAPDLLDRIDALARAAGAAVHHGDTLRRPDEVLENARDAVRIVALLQGLDLENHPNRGSREQEE